MLLTDLAEAARLSGLNVIELDGWETNISAGDFAPLGVLCHHTGAFDEIGDTASDLNYARWLAFTGRPPTVPPPLCNLSLSAECVVYVCCSGNANHAGAAKASGPLPAAGDGSALYIGIEAMNSGSQGWASKGVDAAGNELTQGQAYARLCAALCVHYRRRFEKGFTAAHVRAHRETSVTGKWDPGLLDMDDHRALTAHYIEEYDMPTAEEIAAAVWNHDLTVRGGDRVRAGRVLVQTHTRSDVGGRLKAIAAELGDDATKAQIRRARADIAELAEQLVTPEADDGA